MDGAPGIIAGAIALAFGACAGSFAVTVAYRLPRDISIVMPRSFCESCERPIPWWANVPILAFLAARGRCLMCGASIPARYLGCELVLALCALFLYGNFPLGGAIARFVFVTALLVCSLVDYDWRLIPNLITFPGVPVGFAMAALLMPEVGWESSLIGIAIGGGLLYITGFVYELLRRKEGVGLGDVFLLAMVGAFIGWQGVMFTLFFGALLGSFGGLSVGLFGTPREAPEPPPFARERSESIMQGEPVSIGGATAVPALDAEGAGSSAAESEEHRLLATAVPFGPFLSLAAGVFALFQPQLTSWYLNH
jgi:leader peptidase (prepilin peptidase)/N-methyltransferase